MIISLLVPLITSRQVSIAIWISFCSILELVSFDFLLVNVLLRTRVFFWLLQFVNFTEIMSKNMDRSRKEAEFALAALMEIPSQYKATLELNILG